MIINWRAISYFLVYLVGVEHADHSYALVAVFGLAAIVSYHYAASERSLEKNHDEDHDAQTRGH